MTEIYRGPNRRADCLLAHEETKKQIKEDLEEDWAKDICLCKKEIMGKIDTTKGRQGVMLVILVAILGFGITSAVNSWSKNNIIEHNSDEIEKIQDQHKAMEKAIQKNVKNMDKIEGYMKQQTQIMRALAREHDIEVDIE